MAFASNSGGGAMSDMNVTPLVDVMLVLLIIFMVTAPVATYGIQIDLPQKSVIPPERRVDPPPPILWTLGDVGLLSRPCVAIVGAQGTHCLGVTPAMGGCTSWGEASGPSRRQIARPCGVDAMK